MVNFGNLLRELRQNAGISQKDLAEKIGVTKSVVSYYELQERTPSPEVLKKLAGVFHVSSDYLLGIDNSSKRTIDVSDLDEEDINLINHVVNVLRNKKRN